MSRATMAAISATGYFNPNSLIAVRLLDAPRKHASIDKDFLRQSILRALLRLRDALYDKPFYRLVHAEGDGLPGLTHRPLRRCVRGAGHDCGHGSADRTAARGA